MSLNKYEDNKKKTRLDKKDLIIIGISSVSLILLILIIFISRNRDRALSEALNKNSSLSADELLGNKIRGSYDYLEITEVSGEKWVEIHNKGSEVIDLSGVEIKLSGKCVQKVEKEVLLKKDEYLAIDISADPGTKASNVMTLKVNDEQIQTLLLPKISADQSYGRTDAESNNWGYMKPTKSKANSAKNLQYAKYNGISFSTPGGFYDETFELILEADEGETIYYTTDGTKPTKDSNLYDSGIKIYNKSGSNYIYAAEAFFNRLSAGYSPKTIDAGMIIRAIAVNSAGTVTKEVSQSYFIGLTKDTDYLNTPVLSITTDPENLFDYEEGIYVAGKSKEDALIQGLKAGSYGNYYNEWRKKAKIEFYEPDKGKSFEADLEMTIIPDVACGDYQKNFEFDLGDSDYAVYDGSSIIDFISSQGKLKLLQNFNDNTTKVRNSIIGTFAKKMDVGITDIQPCILFIDGEYWGLYSLNSYLDDKFIERNYNISSSEILFNESQGFNELYNEFYSFATSNDLSIEENYEAVNSMMDIDNYINYVCLNIYVGNSDFYSQKNVAWRTVEDTGKDKADGKWRFMCGDMADTLYLSSKQTSSINSFLQRGLQSDLLLQSLLMNEVFCKKFENQMNKMILEIFTEENYTECINAIVSAMKKPALASYCRFYGGLSDKTYTGLIDNIIAFFEERPDYISKYTKEFTENGGDIQHAKELIAEIEEEEAKAKRDSNIVGDEEISEDEESEGNYREESLEENDIFDINHNGDEETDDEQMQNDLEGDVDVQN